MRIKSKSKSFDYWRNYYRAASRSDQMHDDLIYNNSDKSRVKRCAISKRVFTSKDIKSRFSGDNDVKIKTVESKILDINNHAVMVAAFNDQGEVNRNLVSKYNSEEIEALLDEIEDESESVEEILRIKDILLDPKEWSDSTLFESLRRLQFMDITYFLLKVTKIGKTVNSIRKQCKHRSKRICQLAQILINGWKQIVDEWITDAPTPFTGSEANLTSVDPLDDEDGIPSPPMDEGALFTTQIGLMDLSHFFDGVDDNTSELTQQKRKNDVVVRQNKLVIADSSNRSSPKPAMQLKGHMDEHDKKHDADKQKEDIKPRVLQYMLEGDIPKRPQVGQQDKFKHLDAAAIELKLEASKRKLHEGYQQAEKAKRQRKIQILELCDLPKQEASRQKPFIRSRNHKHHAHRR